MLIEFLEPERCRNDKMQYFPFYAALGRMHGAQVRYLSYGTEYMLDFEDRRGGCYLVRLEGEDLASLEQEIREFQPTHILSADKWVHDMVRHFAEIAPDTLFLCFSEWLRWPLPAVTLRHAAEKRSLLVAEEGDGGSGPLGLWGILTLRPECMPFSFLCPQRMPDDMYMIDIPADYATKMMNAKAYETKAFVRIIGGHHCTSMVPFAGNDFLCGLDVTKWRSQQGCTYCSVTGADARTIRHVRDPIEQALRQLKRVLESTGTQGRNAREYDIYDTHVFQQIEVFLERLFEMQFPPGTFHFSPRINDFLDKLPVLKAWMPRMVQAGYKIALLRIGLENFSPAEQKRFNKGITDEQQAIAFRELRALTQQYPDGFFYKDFGYILFSPYTTLEDLQINLDKSKEYGFRLSSFLVASAIQLDAGTPMIDAVKRDGLHVPERPDDMALFYSTYIAKAIRRNQSYWRFQHPEVGLVFSTIVRIASYLDEAIFGPFFPREEPLFRACVQFYEGLTTDERELWRVLETFVAICRQGPVPADGVALLKLSREWLDNETWRRHLGLPLLSEAAEGFVEGSRPLTVSEREFRGKVERAKAILAAVKKASWSPLPGWELVRADFGPESDGYALRFALKRGASTLELVLATREGDAKGLAVTRHLRLSHGEATTARLTDALRKHVTELLALLELDLYGSPHSHAGNPGKGNA